MLAKLFMILSHISPRIKVFLWKWWYQLLARFYQRKEWTFMNYGYAPLNDQSNGISLDNVDSENRYCIQLYHHVASAVDLKDLKVLEVGSGRGGGAHYIKRYMQPLQMTGVDFSENAINFCKKNFNLNGLSYEIANAESLPFADNSFDVMLNVESSHCYGSITAFLSEVKRVLRKGGYFLFADFRSREEVHELRDALNKSGLTMIKETDITQNIVQALNLDSDRKTEEIQRTIHKLLIKPFIQFSGTRGSKIYQDFKSTETVYLSFVLQK